MKRIVIVLSFLLCGSAAAQGVWEPNGVRTWYNSTLDRTRIHGGGPESNYRDPVDGVWKKSDPAFRLVGGNLIANRGRYKVGFNNTTNEIYIGRGGHKMKMKVAPLYAYRRSTKTKVKLADPDFTDKRWSGDSIIFTNIYPDVNMVVRNTLSGLTQRIFFTPAARVTLDNWWTANGSLPDVYIVNTFRLTLNELNLSMRDRTGAVFDFVGEKDVKAPLSFLSGTEPQFALSEASVYPYPDTLSDSLLLVYTRLLIIGGVPYLAEGFNWKDARALPAGDIEHDATFGETATAGTGSSQRENILYTWPYSPASTGTIDSIYGSYITIAVLTFKGVLFLASDSSCVDSTTHRVFAGTESDGYYGIDFVGGATVTSGTDYFLAFQGNTASSATRINKGTGTTGKNRGIKDKFGSLITACPIGNSIGPPTASESWAMYVVYTVSGGGPTVGDYIHGPLKTQIHGKDGQTVIHKP